MSESDLNQQAFVAADPGDVSYWKGQIDGRWTDFLAELNLYTGRLLVSKAEMDSETGHHKLQTIVGAVTMKLIYGVDDRHLGGWVVFLDGPPSARSESRKELAWLHLSSGGWVNLQGEPFADRFGRPSVEVALRTVVAAKLAFVTSHIHQLAKQPFPAAPQ